MQIHLMPQNVFFVAFCVLVGCEWKFIVVLGKVLIHNISFFGEFVEKFECKQLETMLFDVLQLVVEFESDLKSIMKLLRGFFWGQFIVFFNILRGFC